MACDSPAPIMLAPRRGEASLRINRTFLAILYFAKWRSHYSKTSLATVAFVVITVVIPGGISSSSSSHSGFKCLPSSRIAGGTVYPKALSQETRVIFSACSGATKWNLFCTIMCLHSLVMVSGEASVFRIHVINKFRIVHDLHIIHNILRFCKIDRWQ
jgi:hypothetical protein